MSAFDVVFKAYDIRGTVPEQLDEDMCRAIGVAFARFAAADRILVGHDMRPSGHGLVAAFCDGVRGEGVDVARLGLVSTDLVYYAAGRFDSPGAMFTASHNPAQYNGIKLCLAGARPVGQDTGLARIKADAEAGLPPGSRRGSTSSQDVMGAYADHVRSFADPSVLRPLRVVADTANGMGGLVAP